MLRICVAELDNHYRTVVGEYFGPQRGVHPCTVVATHPAPSFIGPHFTRYCESRKDFIFTYMTALVPNLVGKAVFLAEAQRASAPDGERVHVVVSQICTSPQSQSCGARDARSGLAGTGTDAATLRG